MKNRLSCKMLLMVVSTYQAASGVGAAAMEELELQTREYDFNLSHNGPVQPNGYNEEEMKLVKETRRIWSDLDVFFISDLDVKVTATCIRVPVMRAHAESINLQFENPLDEAETEVPNARQKYTWSKHSESSN
ncbi:Aspartate-semialdehyde dehydrogenase [Linum perenne]